MQTITDKPLLETWPHAREVEESLIGSVLLNQEVLTDSELLAIESGDFYIHRNGEIWDVASTMFKDGKHIDYVTVAAELSQRGKLDEVGGHAYLSLLASRVPTSLGAPQYARTVMDFSTRRKLIQFAHETVKFAYNADTNMTSPAMWSRTEAILDNLMRGITLPQREQFTAEELVSLPVENEQNWLLQGVLVANGLNLLVGEPGAGKTWEALDASIAISTTGSAWGRQSQPGGVLYFGADNMRDDLVRRMNRLCRARGIRPPSDAFILDLSPLDLSDPSDVLMLEREIREHRPRLVVLDAMARYLGDLDENSNADIGRLMAELRRISNDSEVAFLLIHHLRKVSTSLSAERLGDRIRGASDILAAVDSALVMTKKGNGPSMARNLVHVKCRGSSEVEPISMSIEDTENGGVALVYGEGSAPLARESITETCVTLVVEVMSGRPGEVFTTADFRDLLKDRGFEASDATIKRVSKRLRELPSVSASQQGRRILFVWNDEHG